MPYETPAAEPSMTDVVSGILGDFQKLVSQQLSLLRAELRSDWNKTKQAVWPVFVGGTFVIVAVILLGFAAAHGLHTALLPAGADVARIPLWCCFGISAASFAIVGLALIAVGTRSFQSFNPLPDETANAFEKNLKALIDGKVNVANR